MFRMPTFMIFKSGSVINTIRGADVRALTTAIESAVKLASGPAAAYSTPGRTLGGTTPRAGQSLSRSFSVKTIVDSIVAFIGLYLYSLFSLDAYTAAEQSPFNIHRPKDVRTAAAGKMNNASRGSAAAPTGMKLGTLSDLSRD